MHPMHKQRCIFCKACSETPSEGMFWFSQLRSRADGEARGPLRSDRMVMDWTQKEPDQDKIIGGADKTPQLHRAIRARSNKMEVESALKLGRYT